MAKKKNIPIEDIKIVKETIEETSETQKEFEIIPDIKEPKDWLADNPTEEIIEIDISGSEQLQKQGYVVFEILNRDGKTIHKLKRVS